MDIEIELDTLMDLRDDWENFSLPVQRGTARERYLDQRKKIEDEFQRLRLVEAAYMNECGEVEEE